MPPWVLEALNGNERIEPSVLAVRLVASTLLGLIVAGLYHVSTSTRDRGVNRSFLATLVLLCPLITLVTVLVGNNQALAFSLAGVLAIVRFRTVVEDTRDTAFVILAVVNGMAAGVGFVLAGLIVAPLVLLVGLTLRSTPLERRRPLRLVLRTGTTYPGEVLEAILERHVGPYRLAGLATARGGSALDVSFEVLPPTPQAALALVADLSRVEGVQSVELKE